MNRTLLAVAGALLAAPFGLANETYTIKLKLHPAVGQTVKRVNVSKDTGFMKVFDNDGKLLNETRREGKETTDRTTIVAANAAGVPTVFTRIYDKAIESENGRKRELTHQGRPLRYEVQKDGKTRVGLAGPDLDPKDAETLVEKANDPSEEEAILKQLTRDKPVAVGDSWQLDPKPVVAAMSGMKADLAKSTITAKLLKVENRGGHPIGTFEIDIRWVVIGLSKGLDATFDPPAPYTMKGTLELVIDGSSVESVARFKASLKGEAKWTVGKQTGRLVVDMSGDIREDVSAEQRDPTAKIVENVRWLPAAGDWVEVKEKGGVFAARFPVAPKEQPSRKGGNGETTTQWIATEKSGTTYIVALTAFPQLAADPKTVLDAVVANSKGATDVTEVKVDGYPGVEFRRTETRNKIEIEYRQRVVVVGDRLLQQIVAAEKGKTIPADADKFYKGFRITLKSKDD